MISVKKISKSLNNLQNKKKVIIIQMQITICKVIKMYHHVILVIVDV